MLFVCAKYTATVYLFRTLYSVLIVKLVADFHNTCLVAQLRKSKYASTQKIIVSTVFSGCAHLSHCVCVCIYRRPPSISNMLHFRSSPSTQSQASQGSFWHNHQSRLSHGPWGYFHNTVYAATSVN